MFAEKSFLRRAALALAITFLGFMSTAAVSVVLSYWMAEKSISASAALPMAVFSLCFGGFVSGWLASLLHKERGLLNGAVQGSVLAFLLFAVSSWYGVTDQNALLIRCSAILLSALLGGAVGTLMKKPNHRV